MMPEAEKPKSSGDLIFSLYARQNKKINRQNQRITALKMWGRC